MEKKGALEPETKDESTIFETKKKPKKEAKVKEGFERKETQSLESKDLLLNKGRTRIGEDSSKSKSRVLPSKSSTRSNSEEKLKTGGALRKDLDKDIKKKKSTEELEKEKKELWIKLKKNPKDKQTLNRLRIVLSELKAKKEMKRLKRFMELNAK